MSPPTPAPPNPLETAISNEHPMDLLLAVQQHKIKQTTISGVQLEVAREGMVDADVQGYQLEAETEGGRTMSFGLEVISVHAHPIR